MKILGIESSCDETAVAILNGSNDNVDVLSSAVSSQIDIHKKYGGVVPEVAAREHVLNMLPVLHEALEKAGVTRQKASGDLDAIAVASGPGLISSLLAGVETAKALSWIWNRPLVSVNHIAGHIYANFIDTKKSNIKFPAVVLTVSGGHTMLVLMEEINKFKIIGETRDDAAGEAFDKAAKLLGIGYPGGPEIAAKAKELIIKEQKQKIKLPRPMIDKGGFDFSFSGLKTALLYEIKADKNWRKKIPEYAYEFQQAIVDVLIVKTVKAGKKYNAKSIMLAGGVAANTELRQQLSAACIDNKIAFYMPELKYTTDNAAMVAAAGYFKAREKIFTPWEKITVDCNLKL